MGAKVYALPPAKPADGPVLDVDVVDQKGPLPAAPATKLPEPEKPKLIERYAARAPRVLTPGRFDAEATALRKRISWVTAKFLLVDIEFAILRGFALTVRAWWRWMLLSDERQALIDDGRYAMKADKIREARTARVKHSAIGLLVLLVIGYVFVRMAPPQYLKAAGLVLLLGMFCLGFEWSRPRKAVMMGKTTVWGGSVDALRRALIDARLMKEEQELRPVTLPFKEGKGISAVVDLPPGVTVAKCVQRRAEIASGLAVDAAFLSIEKGAHDGQLCIWAAQGDPFSGGSKKLPLLQAERWNAWTAAPFGETARGQIVPLRLLYSNMLLGSKPGSGKTYAARCAVAPYILDPKVRIFAANGKGDPAWDAIQDVAVRFIRGRRDEHARALDAMLAEVIAEMDDRFLHHMQGSKVTEDEDLPLILVAIDELQNYTANGTPGQPVRGQRATLGQNIAEKLIDIIKNGRAAGVVLVMVTQKPSDVSLPTELRSQVGTRWAGRVMDYHTSNMILGQNLSTQGYDASEISAKHPGLGILVPDMEENLLPEELDDFPRVRTYLCDDADWKSLCARGRVLREQEGTLEGEAAGEAAPGDQDVLDEELGEIVEQPLPDLLESIYDFAHGMRDSDRLATTELVERFEPESNTKVLGGQLRRWGAPTGRTGGRGPSGPLVGDVRRAVERIRSGGPENVLETVR